MHQLQQDVVLSQAVPNRRLEETQGRVQTSTKTQEIGLQQGQDACRRVVERGDERRRTQRRARDDIELRMISVAMHNIETTSKKITTPKRKRGFRTKKNPPFSSSSYRCLVAKRRYSLSLPRRESTIIIVASSRRNYSGNSITPSVTAYLSRSLKTAAKIS